MRTEFSLSLTDSFKEVLFNKFDLVFYPAQSNPEVLLVGQSNRMHFVQKRWMKCNRAEQNTGVQRHALT